MLVPRAVERVRGVKKYSNVWSTGYGVVAAAITTKGEREYVSFGLNNHHQLGIAKTGIDTEVLFPIKAELLNPYDIADIDGEHHTVFVTDKGDAYGIGRTEDNRLGNDMDEAVVRTPVQIKFPIDSSSGDNNNNKDDFVGVSVSNSGTFLWTKNGSAYSFGFNNEGELGLGLDDSEESTPAKIQSKHLSNEDEGVSYRTLSISAGAQHTIMLAKNNNK